MDDQTRAISYMESAVMSRLAGASTRLKAATSVSQMLITCGDWERAENILRTAVELLPTTTPRTLSQADRQYNISQFAGMTSRAVSVSLQCGKTPYEALQLSELGNGVLATVQLEVRSDISDLQKAFPVLAKQFCDIRDQLDLQTTDYIQANELAPVGRAANRRHLSDEMDRLLETIRSMKGFEQFLRAPTESKLKELADFGPIVVFNISEIRCDAFIVTVDDIQVVPLEKLTKADLERYTGRFFAAVNTVRPEYYADAKREAHEVLKWLWDVAVGPVFDRFDFIPPVSNDASFPRVWWIGSYLLNILPIHAAGYHELRSTKTVIDRVISSYTPTIKTLGYARERKVQGENVDSQKVMLVGMSETPNEASLPFVDKEITELEQLLSSHMQTTVFSDRLKCETAGQSRDNMEKAATKANVLSALGSHQIVHFSCHGESEVDPSKSRLLLKDGENSPSSLTVAELTELNMQLPQFAYLSACHSASLKDYRLLSESIHLSSAFQLAGFPSVVGTLWQVVDEHSAEMAVDVYGRILVGNRLETERSAESLHHAVRQLRERTRRIPGIKRTLKDDPLIWAPYIYLGV